MEKVSIPHGTIKSHHLCYKRTKCNLFQFHMVRLKDRQSYILTTLRPVSIPHGTIKSRGCSLSIVKKALVSIPHGTIKRVPSAMLLSSWYWVSIPHGTIKRLKYERCDCWLLKFYTFQKYKKQFKIMSTVNHKKMQGCRHTSNNLRYKE